MEQQASLLLDLSNYLRHEGDFVFSEDRASLSLKIHRGLFGSDESKLVLESMESLARTIAYRGRFAESLDLQRRILQGRERLLRPNARSTLRSLGHIGSILRTQGEYAEAEVYFRRQLAAERLLHEERPDELGLKKRLVIALNNVAAVRNDQGECEEAQALLQEALECSRAIHGRDHPLTWMTMELLVETNAQLAKFDESHALLAEVLVGTRKEYGETHHMTRHTRSLYLSLLFPLGNYTLAEVEARSLLEDEISVCDVRRHPTSYSLAFLLFEQKKYGEAEDLSKHLLTVQEEAGDTKRSAKFPNVGPYIDAASTRCLIATCLEAQGKTDEANQYRPTSPSLKPTEIEIEEAKKLHERSLDMYKQGQYKEAEATAKRELEILEEHAGFEDDRTQTCLILIARSLRRQNLYPDAQNITRQVLAYRKRVSGWRAAETQEALRLLATTLEDQGNLEEAEGHYRQLVLWHNNLYGKFDILTYDARWDLSNTLLKQRKYPEVEKLWRLNLEAVSDRPVDGRPQDVAQAYHNLGLALWYQAQNAEAEACFHQAYSLRVELFGRSDATSTISLAFLATVVAEQGGVHDAEELYLLLGETFPLPQSEDEDSDGEDSEGEDSDEEDPDKGVQTEKSSMKIQD